jgi:hypothetical protein
VGTNNITLSTYKGNIKISLASATVVATWYPIHKLHHNIRYMCSIMEEHTLYDNLWIMENTF